MITLSFGRHANAPFAAPRTTAVYTYTVTGAPAGGGILVVLIGARADREVAAHAGRSARTGAPLIAAVALRSTGPKPSGAATVVTSAPITPAHPRRRSRHFRNVSGNAQVIGPRKRENSSRRLSLRSRVKIRTLRPALLTRGIPANTRGEYARRLAGKAW